MAIGRLPQVGMKPPQFAEWYVKEMGWKIIPLGIMSKLPLFPSPHPKGHPCKGECGQLGHGVYDATSDFATIRQWWRDNPTANIGLAVPEGCIAVDVDSTKGGLLTLAKLEQEHGALPDTVTNLTGSGNHSAHYLLTVPPDTHVRGTLGKGIDILQYPGRYLVVPPSQHPDTSQYYMWRSGYDPEDTQIAPAPAWLLEELSRPHGGHTNGATSESPNPIDVGRNVYLTSEAGKMRRLGFSGAEIYAAITVRNETLFAADPLPDHEVRALSFGAERYAPEPEPAQMVNIPTVNPSPVPHMPLPARGKRHEDYPPLPEACLFEDTLTNTAAPWLDAYCAYSEHWAPRATAGFHQAIGLWVLSTVAARRICVELGNPIYPVLFLSMIAESSQYTKTTAAANGYVMLRRAGLSFLLGPDRSTPQAMLRAMSGKVPQDYSQRTEEEQEGIHKRLAFAGQRGWYYEEWGGMLEQMRRTDSPMATFHELLRVLDDGKPEFSSETIQRGMERIEAPYLALLTSATPQDLAPFMRPGSRWWRDGFWPRFAFIVPEEGPRLDRRPQGFADPGGYLIERLHSWHTRLGIPTVSMKEKENTKGNKTGEWAAETSPLPCTIMHLPPATLEAYYVYNEALLQMDVEPELRSIYSRFHDKALRVAMLLASLDGHAEIPLAQWAYGQEVAERWRAMLHRIITNVVHYEPLSIDEQYEQRIERLLAAHGALTSRDIQRLTHLSSGTAIRLLKEMTKAERVVLAQDGKRFVFMLPQDYEVSRDKVDEAQNDVPF